MKHKNVYLIGIAGGSGSGKTSFLRELMSLFTTDQVALVSQDNYYHPREMQEIDAKGIHNYDLPSSIDRKHFYEDMMKLAGGVSIEKLEYNFNNPAWKPEMVVVKPAPVIIMEGLFVFYYQEIMNQLDYKVYIDVHHEERYKRRLRRDLSERGYPEELIRYQWSNHVRPAEEQFVEPFVSECNLVVDNNDHYRDGLNSLTTTIHSYLAKYQ